MISEPLTALDSTIGLAFRVRIRVRIRIRVMVRARFRVRVTRSQPTVDNLSHQILCHRTLI